MKFNLKNRPKPFEDDTKVANEYVAIEIYLGKLEKWFEGFEKELQELLRYYADIEEMHSTQFACDAIKEILGNAAKLDSMEIMDEVERREALGE